MNPLMSKDGDKTTAKNNILPNGFGLAGLGGFFLP